MYATNPRIACSILFDNVPRFVGRSVIYDNPFLRNYGLMDHALDGESKISFFVTNRGNHNVLGID
jgi:hypothetical protein